MEDRRRWGEKGRQSSGLDKKKKKKMTHEKEPVRSKSVEKCGTKIWRSRRNRFREAGKDKKPEKVLTVTKDIGSKRTNSLCSQR